MELLVVDPQMYLKTLGRRHQIEATQIQKLKIRSHLLETKSGLAANVNDLNQMDG